MEQSQSLTQNNNGKMMLSNLDREQLSPKMQSLVQSNRTLNLLFQNDEAKISQYKTPSQQIIIRGILIQQLATLVGMINVGKNMTAPQIEMLAGMIAEDDVCKTFTPSEVMETLKEGIKGTWGKLYDRIDAALIFEWLNQYSKRRDEAIQNFRTAQSQEFKSDSKILISPEVKSETGNEVIANLKSMFKVEKETKQPRELSEPEKIQREIVASIMDEFQRIFNEHPETSEEISGERFIQWDGKMMSRDEFVELRFAEI